MTSFLDRRKRKKRKVILKVFEGRDLQRKRSTVSKMKKIENRGDKGKGSVHVCNVCEVGPH